MSMAGVGRARQGTRGGRAAVAFGGQALSVAEVASGQEVSVFGRLDANTVSEVRGALHDILDRGVGDLLIHLAGAEVHDATGLGVIVGVHHRARRQGRRLVLVDVSPRLDRLLRGSRLHRVLSRGPDDRSFAVLPQAETVPSLTETVLPMAETALSLTETVLPMGDPLLSSSETVLPFTD